VERALLPACLQRQKPAGKVPAPQGRPGD